MEKAILIGVQTYTSHSFEERMEEMKELALACDIEICMSISQNLEHPHKKYGTTSRKRTHKIDKF